MNVFESSKERLLCRRYGHMHKDIGEQNYRKWREVNQPDYNASKSVGFSETYWQKAPSHSF